MSRWTLLAGGLGLAFTAGPLAFFPSAVAVATFLFPDPERWARLLPAFFTAMTRLAVRYGEAVALGRPPRAVALWLSPDREPPTETAFAEVGIRDVDAMLDEDEAARLAALTSHMDEAHERVMDEPHWYLPFLAVAPESQEQGLVPLACPATSIPRTSETCRSTSAGLTCSRGYSTWPAR